jgi:TolB-like protein/Tfp pilus assembly protein PilF
MAVLYVVAAWLIMQVAEVVIGLAELPGWIGQLVLLVLAIGFPIALVFSWFYELTPEGISLEKDIDPAESITRVTGRRLDFIVIALLVAAVLLFAYDKWWTGPPPERSIAVLAFENMSGDPEQEYFSDGISEELLNLLAQIPELTVISRSSAFSFKGKNVAIPAIAEQLNVAHVLEGSVRRDGNRVRITAQLIEANSDSHLWSESYDREFENIFAIQEEVAAAISDVLRARFATAPGGSKQPTVIRSASMDAYDAYLRGRELVYRREHMDEAIRQLELSVRLDNNFAPAHAQLAIAIGLSEPVLEEAKRRALPHLDRAQELEPDLAEGHGGRALLAGFAGDPESAIEHARKALASNSSYLDAMNWLQMALASVGRNEEGIAVLENMLEVDPLNVVGLFNRSWYLGWMGRIEEAHDLANRLITQSESMGYWARAQLLLIWEGEIAEALHWFLKAMAVEPGDWGSAYPVNAFIWVDEYDEARRISDSMAYLVDVTEGRFDIAIQATQRYLQSDPEDKSTIAMAADALYEAGRTDEALSLYERLGDFVPEGRPIQFSRPMTMRLALARRRASDEDGAQAAAEIVTKDLLRLATQPRTSDVDNHELRRERAMLAAFERDPERVITHLDSAVRLGMRDPQVFRDPIFKDWRDDPRFIAIQHDLEEILDGERDKVLQLICFNNPTPDDWRPLPETCEGVVQQGGT